MRNEFCSSACNLLPQVEKARKNLVEDSVVAKYRDPCKDADEAVCQERNDNQDEKDGLVSASCHGIAAGKCNENCHDC